MKKAEFNGRTSDGKFAPGNPGKPHGSSKNKMRDKLRTFLDERWEEFPEWFGELTPKEKVQTVIDLMPYAVSRLQSVAASDGEGNDIEPKRTFIAWDKLDEKTIHNILSNTHDTEN